MKILSVLAVLFLCVTALPVKATESADLAVALKTLPLLASHISSPARVAIVYDNAVPASRADAEKIKAIFDNGIAAPEDLKLVTQLVDLSDLSDFNGFKIAFIAEHIPTSDYGRISIAAANASVLTICADIKCVAADTCVLGVASSPQVEVYYSPAAAEKSKIRFVSAFTMLAKQVGTM